MAIVFIMVFLLLCTSTPSHALWWMGYHKSAFKGKIIDAETKKPIEGAVVVVTYDKYVFRFMPETGSFVFDVRETLTDKEGIFYIPSYTTIIDPFAWEGDAIFIIFKPGYGSFPHYRVTPPMELSLPAIEEFFSSEIGTKGEIGWDYKTYKKIKVTFGIVELPGLKTREEREKGLSIPNLPLEFPCYKIKNLVQLLRKEYINLGYSHRERRDCHDEKE